MSGGDGAAVEKKLAEVGKLLGLLWFLIGSPEVGEGIVGRSGVE